MKRKRNEQLKKRLQELRNEMTRSIGVNHLMGTSDGVRTAFETVVHQQRKMLDLVEDILIVDVKW